MLRREADGIDWYVRRQALLDRTEPARSLTLSLTAHSEPHAVSRLVWDLSDLLEARVRTVGVRLRRSRLTAWVDGRDEFSARWTDASRTEAAELAADERAAALFLEWSASAVPDGQVRLKGALTMHQDTDQPGLWGLSLALTPDAWGATVPLLDELAEILTQALAEAGSRAQVDYGAVVFDFITGETLHRLPYELVFGITEGYQDAAHYARGYYWANLLTTGHLAKLGGQDAFPARCAQHGMGATVIERDSTPAVLVRDPAPITAFDDERLAAMRDLLDPALRHLPYRWYAGWPLRVFKEPGTAFRPVPPDIIEPWFEDDGPLPSAGTAYRLVPDA